MKRVRVLACAVVSGILVSLSGCFQEVPRLASGPSINGEPTPAPSSFPTPTVSPTVQLTPLPTVAPSPLPTSRPGPTETPRPTATAEPTPTKAPSLTPVPPPTQGVPPTLIPAPTPTPVPQLVLQLRAPEDGSQVSATVVVVHGTTNPDAAVTINGEPVKVEPDGQFRGEAKLVRGTNGIQVVATDVFGNLERRLVNVTSLAVAPLPMMLVVTKPADRSIVSTSFIRLSGRTGPEAVLSVNGVSVAVDMLGVFSTTVVLDPGPNLIDLVATNRDGQTMSAVIAVIFRP